MFDIQNGLQIPQGEKDSLLFLLVYFHFAYSEHLHMVIVTPPFAQSSYM